jgi:hypothetical protein
MKPGLRILSVTALLSAGCVGEDPSAALAQRSAPLTYASTTTECPNSIYGPITVTLHHNGVTPAGAGVCELFDGNFSVGEFAVIMNNSTARLKIDLQFPVKRTLSGVRTEVGGYTDLPAGYSYRVNAFCDQESVDFPQYLSYTDKKTSLAFTAPCTTDRISIGFSRDHHDGMEHITEIQPVFVDGTQPVSGDHIAYLEHEAVQTCFPSERLSAADILSSTGTAMGRIQLWRALCFQASTNQNVYVYYARSSTTVGAPLDMDVMSAYVQLTGSTGSPFKVGPSIATVQNPAGSILKSNVWARTPDQTAVKVAACARFYPDNAAKESVPSATGCTADYVLP